MAVTPLISLVVIGLISGVCSETTTVTPQPCQLKEGVETEVVEIHCRGYKECDNNIIIEYNCGQNQVLDRETMHCVDTSTSTITCTDSNQCSNKADGSYADESDKCETYVRCIGGQIIGHLYCPKTLVFNNVIEACDFPINVLPPCGTKPVVG